MGSAGNVAFLFERKGMILVDGEGKDEDAMMGIALDAGAEDLKASGGQFEITTDPASFAQVKAALEKAGVNIETAEVAQVPKAPVDVDEETGKKITKLMESLDDHDDVQNVYTTANLTAAMMEA
jgi:transcriptional/translational regulatory protein YebC/TACO1